MKNRAAACLIFALSLLAYSNSFTAGFHFDDYHQIVKNPNIRSLANLPVFFTRAGLGSYHIDDKGFRPLTVASFAVNHALSGNLVWSYHVFNFLLHLINALLVYFIASAILREAGRKDGFPVALFTALAFALHPIQTNAVTYISGRAALMASFFCLMALLSYIRFREGGKGRFWMGASALFFLLGLLSKEMAVGFIGMALAYDLIFTAPKKGGLAGAARTASYYAPFLAVLGFYLALKKSLQGYYAVKDVAFGVHEYLMSEAKALLLYLRLLALPTNQNADYFLPVTGSVDQFVVLSFLLVALCLVWLYRMRRRSPAAAFFGLWFFIALAPESSFIPILDIAFEYRLYLPSAGFIAAVSVMAGDLKMRAPVKGYAAAAALALLLLLTFNRNAVWATDYTLWSDVVKKSPGSPRAYASLGEALLRDKRYLEAIGYFRQSLEVGPEYSQRDAVYNNMGICHAELGMMEEAVEDFKDALAANRGLADAYSNLGVAYDKLGRVRESIEALRESARLDPYNALTHLNLAMEYEKLALHAEELREMKEALRLSPKDFDVRYVLALAYYNNGMPADAVEQARTAKGFAVNDAQTSAADELLKKLEARAGGQK